jgi:hypothetical protein
LRQTLPADDPVIKTDAPSAAKCLAVASGLQRSPHETMMAPDFNDYVPFAEVVNNKGTLASRTGLAGSGMPKTPPSACRRYWTQLSRAKSSGARGRFRCAKYDGAPTTATFIGPITQTAIMSAAATE